MTETNNENVKIILPTFEQFIESSMENGDPIQNGKHMMLITAFGVLHGSKVIPAVETEEELWEVLRFIAVGAVEENNSEQDNQDSELG